MRLEGKGEGEEGYVNSYEKETAEMSEGKKKKDKKKFYNSKYLVCPARKPGVPHL